MDEPNQNKTPLIIAAVPGILACVGVVWLGTRMADVSDRLTALAQAPPRATAMVQDTDPAMGQPAPGSSAPEVAASASAVDEGPAEPLDSAEFDKAFSTDATQQKAATECWGSSKTEAAASFVIRVDTQGHVTKAEPPKDSEPTPAVGCLLDVVPSVRLPPGKVREGTVTIKRKP